MSNSYIKRLARANGLYYQRAKKRLELNLDVVAKRLIWCRVRAQQGVDRWRKYIQSNECLVERGKGKKQVQVYRIHADKQKPTHVETYRKGKDLRIIVWACFWGYRDGCLRLPLFLIDRDFEAKKHSYSANSYIVVLEEHLVDASANSYIFIHDNALIHTTIKVRKWLEDNSVDTTDWPLYSPDLNPIEHAQKALKEKVIEMFPDLQNSYRAREVTIKAIKEALKEAQDTLPDLLFDSLLESMPARIQACIDTKGWHTKY